MNFFCVCENFKFIRDLLLYPSRLVVALVRCCCTISFRTRNLEDFQDLYYISRSLVQATQADTEHKKNLIHFPGSKQSARIRYLKKKKSFPRLFLLSSSSWQIYCHQSGSVQVKWVRMSTRRLPTISSLKRTESSEKSTMMRTSQVAVWWRHWWVFLRFFLCLSFFSVKVDRTQSDNNKLSLIAKWLITEINLRENLVKEKRLLFFPPLYCGRYFFVVVVYFRSAIVGCLLFIVWLPLITLCVTLVKEHALFLFLLFMHNGVMTAERAQEQPAILHPFLTFHKSSGWGNWRQKGIKEGECGWSEEVPKMQIWPF